MMSKGGGDTSGGGGGGEADGSCISAYPSFYDILNP